MSNTTQITVGMHEAKTRLSELVKQVLENNADVVITQRNKPVMRLVPYQETRKSRGFGALKGKIDIADDFDQTPEDVIDSFYGSDKDEQGKQ